MIHFPWIFLANQRFFENQISWLPDFQNTGIRDSRMLQNTRINKDYQIPESSDFQTTGLPNHQISRQPDCRNIRFPSYRIPESSDYRIPKSSDFQTTRFPNHQNSELQIIGLPNQKISELWVSRIFRYLNYQIPEIFRFPKYRIPKSSDFRITGFPSHQISELPDS